MTPEEKNRIRAKHRERKAARAERKKFYEDNRKRRDGYDRLGNTAQLGDWIRYQENYGYAHLSGKICRIVSWNDDDGYNNKRAGRNKRIIIEIEPHLYDNPRTMHINFSGFTPVNEMEVIAEAAR